MCVNAEKLAEVHLTRFVGLAARTASPGAFAAPMADGSMDDCRKMIVTSVHHRGLWLSRERMYSVDQCEVEVGSDARLD